MNSHISSFFITLLLYLAIFGILTYTLAKEELFTKEKTIQTQEKISFRVFTVEPIQEKKIEKRVEKKVEKKIEKKIEKKVIKTPKKIIEKPVEVLKEEPKEEPQKKIIEEKQEETIPQESAQITPPQINNAPKPKVDEEALLKAKQELFLAELVERINQNKSYPLSARRRAIEGEINMEFTIFADGSVHNIAMISGKKIFQKSASLAIAKSFPITIDNTLFIFPKRFTITLVYVLK